MVTNQSVYDAMCEVYRKFLCGELVEVTRCKDCKWWDRNIFECEKAYEHMTGEREKVGYETWHDYFCADGKRREKE